MSAPLVTPEVDLDECAREPIHIPGSIQPHGALLACDDDLTVLQASDNLFELTGIAAKDACGRAIEALLGLEVAQGVARARDQGSVDQPLGLNLDLGGRQLYALVHQHLGVTLLELERRTPGAPDFSVPVEALWRLQAAPTLPSLFRRVADEVRALTGFERVVVYRFDPDDSGHVMAESRVDDLEPYLDLHFPASDIPAQARRLYLVNRVRLIPDARGAAVALVPARRPGTDEPLDLSHAWLRAVSPMHLEYMANMGVRASMSISLVVGGRLWGIITCGSRKVNLPVPGVRAACDLIGRMTSLQLAAMQELEAAEARTERAAQTRAIADDLAAVPDLMTALVAHADRLLALCDAGGVAIMFDGEWRSFGRVPPPEALGSISDWLRDHHSSDVVSTHSLSRELPALAASADVASGLVAFSMPRPLEQRLLWFRPEVIQSVKWGGDPEKPADAASGRPRPRRSFEAWEQSVRGISLPWERSILVAVADLRRHCIERDLVLQVGRAQTAQLELRRTLEVLAAKHETLQLVERQKEELTVLIVHDLKNPLAAILPNARFILKTTGLGNDERDAATDIETSAHSMLRMVLDLLDISRAEDGQLHAKSEPVNFPGLLEAVQQQAHRRATVQGRRFELDLARVPAVVRTDSELVRRVLENLVDNALKYTPAGTAVSLSAEPQSGGALLLRVRDEGGGIAFEDRARIFEKYTQLGSPHAASRSSRGLGLSFCKLAVEALGGRIWVEENQPRGSCFCVHLPLLS